MGCFRKYHASALLLVCLSASCGTSHKPCTQGGELDNIPLIKGDRQCFQRKNSEGRYVNDGNFIQRHPNGKIAIEGEFSDGRKTGLWLFYDDKGKKTAERFFRNGIETSIPSETGEKTGRK